MKKLFSIFAAACLMAACNSSSNTSSTDSTATMSADTTTAMSADTTSMAAPATTDTSAMNSATMKDGVMMMKDGKMMVMQSGSWAPMTAEVTCTNGVKVKTNGEVSKGKRKKTLTEGMMIDKDGQMTDANGKLVDNAGW